MEANREFKDTVFSKLFGEPDKLRELYNALAGTNYDEDTPIEINTLENVLFKSLRNDLSFTIGGKYVVLLEHQSTLNCNMPLRCLMYITRIYEKITDDRAIFHDRILKIPTPEFIVLYNGAKDFPTEETLKLSDAYLVKDKPQDDIYNLELKVRMVNINPGHNDELLLRSKTLGEYTTFVESVKENQRSGCHLSAAVNNAIDWCLTNGVLEVFLNEHGSEVRNMLMTEFNIDIAKEVWQEEAHEKAFEEASEKYEKQIADKDAEIADKDAEIAKLAALVTELQRG